MKLLLNSFYDQAFKKRFNHKNMSLFLNPVTKEENIYLDPAQILKLLRNKIGYLEIK